MFRKTLLVFLVVFNARLAAPGELTLEEGERLLRQFVPEHYKKMTLEQADYCLGPFGEFYRILHRINYPWGAPPEPLLNDSEPRQWGGGQAAFLELQGPWRPTKRYVLLFYLDDWVLIESKDDGKTWEAVQDAGATLDFYRERDPDGLTGGILAQADVDLDDVPEVLIGGEGDPREGFEDLYIYAFRDGRMQLISPAKTGQTSEHTEACYGRRLYIATELRSPNNENGVILDDVDRDNVAEVVVRPGLRDWDEAIDGSWEEYSGSPGPRCRQCVEMDQPIRVYKLINGYYRLWKEIDRHEEFPFGYPALGVFHPAVVTYSQLKNGQGLGELRVFVSTPAIGWVERGPRMTVDDYDVTSFVVAFNSRPLKFRKKWENKRFAELGKGDQAVNGVWVYELERKGCPPWEVNPAEVAYPHPDPCREYAFVGPYMEFSVRREDVADFILRSAEKRYKELETLKAQGAPLRGPEREVVFVQVDILGSMKNGKRVLVQALIGVKKDTSPQAPKAAAGK